MTPKRMAQLRLLATVCDSVVSIRTQSLHDLLVAFDDERQHADALYCELRELAALVRGECASLLDEDRGGSAEQSMRIDDVLEAHATRRGKDGEGR